MKRQRRHISGIIVIALLLFMTAGRQAHAQQFGIKTNALQWAALTPNFGCEFVIKEHSSLDVSAFGHYKPYGLDSKLIAVQPEFRYWISGRPLIREFVGLSLMGASYDMTIRDYVYDGVAASIGVTGGYAFLIGKGWRLELCGGLSFLFYNQKQHYKQDDYYLGDSVPADDWGYKLFPAKLGVSFTYIIK